MTCTVSAATKPTCITNFSSRSMTGGPFGGWNLTMRADFACSMPDLLPEADYCDLIR